MVAAIGIKLHGDGRAAVLAGGLSLIGFIAMLLASVAATAGAAWLQWPARLLVWAIVVFFVTFLAFTISAYAVCLPHPWVNFLSINCGDLPPRLLVSYNRVADFSQLKCLPDGKRNDVVLLTDTVKFLTGIPASGKYVKDLNVSKEADVEVTDLVKGDTQQPTLTVGGNEKYGVVSVEIDKKSNEARLRWTYRNGHSTDEEGVGFSAMRHPLLVVSATVEYKFPPGMRQITNRRFSPASLEDGICKRKANGFECSQINTDQLFQETWNWDVWKDCHQ